VLNFDRSTVKHALQNIQNDRHQWLSHSFIECIKFVFDRGSARDPAGELTALPQTLSWFMRDLLLRGNNRRGGKEGKETGGEGEGTPPNANS